ncbi:MAG: pteridine reductase [Betaproteobacteria bacterium]|nr:pteridine reductase [Betaproteobacteria bacterium]
MNSKTVLITGAARRIGRAIAVHLHAAGANVVVHYRNNGAAAKDLTAQLNALRPGSACAAAADLCRLPELEQLASTARERFGRIDALVNNASSFYPTPLGSVDPEIWNDIVGSNFQAPFFLSQALAPDLRATRGAIVNIVDIHAEKPFAGYPLYCATKGALLTLTRALAIELAPEVRVNAVSPGAILWPEDGRLFSGDERRSIVEHSLLRREGTAEDIARAVSFLLDDASYITGQILNVDGGRSAHL